ncbi:uncharacterized protein LOC121747930 isoform X1 [Salvia splendens]|uniref:uncharacterized protein LOC121747930 isoform X1 n=1 Tax=Salvia splendens TaxID=180675 RepID=UPI001C2526FC|nr:uncharacterized protein LOC121747930 isoform X1 [Salvia splendens]
MGHKKRKPAPRSKPSPAAAEDAESSNGAAAIVDCGDSVLDNSAESINGTSAKLESSISVGNGNVASSPLYASVKLEYEKALVAFRRGNHTKALRLMKDLCCKHENSPLSALIHRVQGTLCVKVASTISDPNVKQRHMKSAIESARKASRQSPSSIEFAHFYANLLCDAANDAKEYEEVMQECERALAIENPVDPATENLQEESQQKISTPEARISNVQSELSALVRRANLGSLSTWMQHLGEQKFRFIPIRSAPEDPMELRLVQAKRPNEIKKVAKTEEERRKEVEVRVAAARLMQQQSESPHLGNGGDNNTNNSKDSVLGSGQRVGERRKSGNMRKSASSDERMDLVKSYWNTLSPEGKKDLLTVKISDIRAHFSSLKDCTFSEVLNEALSFGEANKIWKFWVCCRCNEKFADVSSFTHHVVQEHLRSSLPKMQSILPENVDDEWVEMLLNCIWKPVDSNVAIRMLEKQLKSDTHDLLEESSCKHNADDSKECYLDTYCNEYEGDSSPGKKTSSEDCNGSKQDIRKFEDVEWMDCNDLPSSKENLFFDWPLSDDPERTKLLERIHSLFEALIKHKCLASSHLSKIIHFALEELQSIAYGSQLDFKVNQTPLCICFLGAPELKKIQNFLQEIYQTCGLKRYSDKTAIGDDSSCPGQGDIMEKITLRQDASLLVIDEQCLPCKIPCLSSSNVVSYVSGTPVTSHLSYDNGVILDSDALLSWIFTCASASEQLASWKCATAEKAQQGLEILQLLEKESCHLQDLCERKCEQLNYEEALQALEDMCLEEGRKRENAVGFVCQSYEYVLKKRREELIEDGCGITLISNRFELEAIANVLKDAESLNMNQFGIEEAYNGITSLRDLGSGQEYDWRMKDHLHQVDSCVEAAIQRQKEHASTEISKIDARIMRTVSGMQQLEVKLEAASHHDFRSILLPLVISFVRAHLVDLAEKDATKKSDAARDAFLAELAQDSKKGGTIIDGSKPVHERARDKKKCRDNPKNNDQKATNNGNLHGQTDKAILFPSDQEVEGPGFEITSSGRVDALKVHSEENQKRSELEAEERKLEETLEYQRHVENEAKQNHLAGQHKRALNITNGKTESFEILEAYRKPSDDEKYVNEQQKNMKGLVIQEGGVANYMEGTVKNYANEPLLRNGLPNEGVPHDGGLYFEQRSGRRGRRHRGPTKYVDGNDFGLPSLRKSSPGEGDDVENMLRRHLVEKDDEERFQADIKKAVRQSLDGENGKETCGTGLKNEVGEYNCFLNVIIQSLWHLRRFRDEFLGKPSSEHVHVGNLCVICSLHDIFIALSLASTDKKREAVAPTSLRVALSNLYPDSNFFQEGQMNDASEVLEVIFNCLHQAFTPACDLSDTESVDGKCKCPCIAHLIFGMDILERMNCYNCSLESRYLKYTSFFHNTNASALRTMKVMYPEDSFDELLNLVEMNHQLPCDPEAGGCGKPNYIHHLLSRPPHVFTTVLGWQNTCENVEVIKATLVALSTEIDISALYRGLDPRNRHRLVSVVCYYGQHYHCFAYSRDHEHWMMYDDNTVKVIGCWNDVIAMCERGHLQPQVLFYEAAD